MLSVFKSIWNCSSVPVRLIFYIYISTVVTAEIHIMKYNGLISEFILNIMVFGWWIGCAFFALYLKKKAEIEKDLQQHRKLL